MKMLSLNWGSPNKHQRTLLERFFYDEDFKGVYESCLEDLANVSMEGLELGFASGAIIGEDLNIFKGLFPEPMNIQQLRRILNAQIKLEESENRRGIFSRPLHVDKIVFAAMLGLENKKSVFIELGTYLGHSIRKLSNIFEKCYTVEASETIYTAAKKLFEFTESSINATLGSSVELLKTLPTQDGNNAVIFLDAHYSTGITSRKYGECPLFDELEVIFNRFPNAICVIDDMRTMNGKGDYPKFMEIINYLPSSRELRLKYDQGIIFGASTGGSTL